MDTADIYVKKKKKNPKKNPAPVRSPESRVDLEPECVAIKGQPVISCAVGVFGHAGVKSEE